MGEAEVAGPSRWAPYLYAFLISSEEAPFSRPRTLYKLSPARDIFRWGRPGSAMLLCIGGGMGGVSHHAHALQAAATTLWGRTGEDKGSWVQGLAHQLFQLPRACRGACAGQDPVTHCRAISSWQSRQAAVCAGQRGTAAQGIPLPSQGPLSRAPGGIREPCRHQLSSRGQAQSSHATAGAHSTSEEAGNSSFPAGPAPPPGLGLPPARREGQASSAYTSLLTKPSLLHTTRSP